MRRWILCAALIAASTLLADDNRITMGFSMKPRIEFHEDCRIYMRRDEIHIVKNEDRDERVVITENHELIVNDESVTLDSLQSALTQQYYDLTERCLDGARRIGKEGAKVGWEGAKIGLKAIGGVFKLILPNYDAEDLERDMERESEKIEAKAEVLEEKAEVLDELLDELEDVHYELKDAVQQLDELSWF